MYAKMKHTCDHHKQLIPEQHMGKQNPMYQLNLDLHIMSPHTKQTDQFSNITSAQTQYHLYHVSN
jgi:hypothetical protein